MNGDFSCLKLFAVVGNVSADQILSVQGLNFKTDNI